MLATDRQLRAIDCRVPDLFLGILDDAGRGISHSQEELVGERHGEDLRIRAFLSQLFDRFYEHVSEPFALCFGVNGERNKLAERRRIIVQRCATDHASGLVADDTVIGKVVLHELLGAHERQALRRKCVVERCDRGDIVVARRLDCETRCLHSGDYRRDLRRTQPYGQSLRTLPSRETVSVSATEPRVTTSVRLDAP